MSPIITMFLTSFICAIAASLVLAQRRSARLGWQSELNGIRDETLVAPSFNDLRAVEAAGDIAPPQAGGVWTDIVGLRTKQAEAAAGTPQAEPAAHDLPDEPIAEPIVPRYESSPGVVAEAPFQPLVIPTYVPTAEVASDEPFEPLVMPSYEPAAQMPAGEPFDMAMPTYEPFDMAMPSYEPAPEAAVDAQPEALTEPIPEQAAEPADPAPAFVEDPVRDDDVEAAPAAALAASWRPVPVQPVEVVMDDGATVQEVTSAGVRMRIGAGTPGVTHDPTRGLQVRLDAGWCWCRTEAAGVMPTLLVPGAVVRPSVSTTMLIVVEADGSCFAVVADGDVELNRPAGRTSLNRGALVDLAPDGRFQVDAASDEEIEADALVVTNRALDHS
ncbi:MAG: hypothetical protein JWM05_1100 [Acidimicrobiales bacterium]|nr:hypothetical protein [Acidimicrobiales bacterium]